MNFIIALLAAMKNELTLLNHGKSRLSNDTIITDILDNDISITLEKVSILSDKSSSNDVPNKYSEKLSNNTIDIINNIITSANETVRHKSQCTDTDAIYCHISKSKATNCFSAEWFRISSVLSNKPTMQGLDSYFIVTHANEKGPQNIKSQPRNDNIQSDPESNLFSNQTEPDLVSSDDTIPIVNNTVTT